MFRNQDYSPPPQNNLRRRYQAVTERQQRKGVRLGSQEWRWDASGGLELSMHLPPKASGNRFDALSPESPTLKPAREPYVPPFRRRSRFGRGSREAKRRRDARRNQRKHQAVQTLDEQLSRNIDRTLSQANMRQPPRLHLTSPVPSSSPSRLPSPKPIRVPPAPPQLPYLNFGGLDLMDDCPSLTPSSQTPLRPSPMPTPLSIPSWCPALPAFVNNHKNSSEFPLFFDLSMLPEPKQSPKPDAAGKELQLWRPKACPRPKKQSRFFPPPTAPQPEVEHVLTACKLHATDSGPKDVMNAKPEPLMGSIEHTINRAETAANADGSREAQATAANLWCILNREEQPHRWDDNELYLGYQPTRNALDELDLETYNYQLQDNVFAAPYGTYDHRLESVGMPFELEDTEVPYVHANCLTGHANEHGGELVAFIEENKVVFIPAPKITAMPEDMCGLNELVVDQYTEEGSANALLAVLELPPLPPSPKPPAADDDAKSDQPVFVGRESHDDPSSGSDAHFSGEQALFDLPSLSADHDMSDVANYVATEHPLECWCNDCAEPPDLVGWEAVTDDDDEWTDFSSGSGAASPLEPSDCSDWEWEWGMAIEDDDIEATGYQFANSLESNDVFPCTPSSLARSAW